MNQTLDRNDLVKKMNLGGVPTDVQDQVIAQYGENVLKTVTLEVVSLLSEDDRKIFESLIKSNDQKGTEKFLTEKVPNLDALIKETSDEQIKKINAAMSAEA